MHELSSMFYDGKECNEVKAIDKIFIVFVSYRKGFEKCSIQSLGLARDGVMS